MSARATSKGATTEAERARLVQALKERDFPLSFAQQRLWFLDQLDPGGSDYSVAASRRFVGPLDRSALTHALTELVRRHESLRTTFPSRAGEPIQHIADPKPVVLQIIPLESLPRDKRAAALSQVIHEQSQQPFDLARGPLFRPVLIALGPEEHELLVMVHLIVADAWSLGIIARELAELYEANQAGRPASLPELPVQYADFTLWQRLAVSGELLESQLRYWREQLSGWPTQLELPADYPRSRGRTAAGASYAHTVPPVLAGRLRDLSQSERTTLFMTLVAAFKVLLARYSGQDEVLIGTSIANRTHVELESVVGFFANALVLRTSLTGDPTFRLFLARVRRTCLDAYAHSDLPFERLVEELQPERVLGQNPWFQVSFVMQNPATPVDFAFVNVASPFAVTLFVSEGADGSLRTTFQYKRDVFEPDTIARLAVHFRTLLEGVAADPDSRLSTLPLLTDSESHQLLIEWNATTTPYPRDRLVHRLFEDQVDAMPDAVALVCGDVSLTYRELDRRANRLARHLLAVGVKASSRVGVWIPRSPEMIVALLAVLKAGSAYVPLDVLAPVDRVSWMIGDAKIDIVLTSAETHGALPPGTHAVCLDADVPTIEGQLETAPETRISSEDLAHIMYTSGTTDVPNGVAVSHRSIVRLVRGTDYARFGRDEVFLQLTPATRDASVFEIWGALLNGGCLAVAPASSFAVEKLGAVIERHRATTLCVAAGQLQEIADTRLEVLSPLHQVVVANDVLSPRYVRRAMNAFPELHLVNGYGPVEGTVFTCCHTVTNTQAGRSLPIGRPIANTRVYVLDRHRQPVPIGVPGEIWIAGDGLAQGYIDRPELTADRFVVLRLRGREERLYRSGDRARWLPDGTLEFLGRSDDQREIRGFRVALGDIEAALTLHPKVRESAVVVRRTPDGRDDLVAYVAGPDPADSPGVRPFLSRMLPGYMVPTALILMDHLPRTPDGRVDRHALPQPSDSSLLTEAIIEPRDELERQLAAIWQALLPVNHIGIRDSFFDLGGHSLLAARMFARLEEQLRVRLPLATLFQSPTIEGLAAAIRRGASPEQEHSLVAIKPAGRWPPLFGMPGINGILFSFHNLAQYLTPDQPLYALQSRGLDGSGVPLTRIEDMASEFLREIREIQPEGPYYLVGWCFGGVVAYEAAQQLRAAGEEIGLLALIATWPPAAAPDYQFKRVSRTLALIESVTDRLRRYARTLARLGGLERMQYLRERIMLLVEIGAWRNLFHGNFNQKLVVQANLIALSNYRPESYPGPVVLFAEGAPIAHDYQRAWRELAAGELEVFTVPCGDYRNLLDAPNVQQVAEYLTTCIERGRISSSHRRRV